MRRTEPLNYDKKFHGMVPLRLALAYSTTTAAARLGTEPRRRARARQRAQAGVEREVRPFASSMLGAVDMSPFEVAQMYQTIASGGWRSPLRSIREITTQDGKPLQRYPLAVEQAFPPEPIYLLAAAMQGVVREGTGQGLKSYLPPEVTIAGKTGTTDEQRDAWFAGFSGDRLAVVWVGYDDNRAARLSGSSAALPIWGDLMSALSPEPLALGHGRDGVDRSAAGCAAAPAVPGRSELPFMQGSAPTERAPCSGPMDAAVEAAGEVGQAVGETVARQDFPRAPVRPMKHVHAEKIRTLFAKRVRPLSGGPGCRLRHDPGTFPTAKSSPGAATRGATTSRTAARAPSAAARGNYGRRRLDGLRARRHRRRPSAERRRNARARRASSRATRGCGHEPARCGCGSATTRRPRASRRARIRSPASGDGSRGMPTSVDRRRARTALCVRPENPQNPDRAFPA